MGDPKREITITIRPFQLWATQELKFFADFVNTAGIGAQTIKSVAHDLMLESRNHKGIRADIYRQLSEGLSNCSVTITEPLERDSSETGGDV